MGQEIFYLPSKKDIVLLFVVCIVCSLTGVIFTTNYYKENVEKPIREEAIDENWDCYLNGELVDIKSIDITDYQYKIIYYPDENKVLVTSGRFRFF